MKQIVNLTKYEIIRSDCNHALINQKIQINKLDVSGNIISEVVLDYDTLRNLFQTNPLKFISQFEDYKYMEKQIK